MEDHQILTTDAMDVMVDVMVDVVVDLREKTVVDAAVEARDGGGAAGPGAEAGPDHAADPGTAGPDPDPSPVHGPAPSPAPAKAKARPSPHRGLAPGPGPSPSLSPGTGLQCPTKDRSPDRGPEARLSHRERTEPRLLKQRHATYVFRRDPPHPTPPRTPLSADSG